jgi:hypothetical protein
MNDTIIAQQAAQIAALERRLRRLEDIEAIKVVQRTYGYLVDKALWSDLADLFSKDGEIEIGGRGVYKGHDRIHVFLRDVMGKGHDGLVHGQLMNHMQLQGIVSLEEGADVASGRWRAFIQAGEFGKHAQFAEGVYENEYVREDGVWKISRLTWFATYYTPYEKGFGQETLPLTTMSESFPPDRLPTYQYAALPEIFTPPFHYPHPVTGNEIGRNAKPA